jgi:hypothetical protein
MLKENIPSFMHPCNNLLQKKAIFPLICIRSSVELSLSGPASNALRLSNGDSPLPSSSLNLAPRIQILLNFDHHFVIQRIEYHKRNANNSGDGGKNAHQ